MTSYDYHRWLLRLGAAIEDRCESYVPTGQSEFTAPQSESLPGSVAIVVLDLSYLALSSYKMGGCGCT